MNALSKSRVFCLRMLPQIVGWVFLISCTANAQEVISWRLIEKVEFKQGTDGWLPNFDEGLEAINGKQVIIRGFMTPLDMVMDQKHFVLSPYDTSDCQYCLPGGPETMVEVKAAKNVEYNYELRRIKGTFVLLRDDPYGMLYQLVEAEEVR